MKSEATGYKRLYGHDRSSKVLECAENYTRGNRNGRKAASKASAASSRTLDGERKRARIEDRPVSLRRRVKSPFASSTRKSLDQIVPSQRATGGAMGPRDTNTRLGHELSSNSRHAAAGLVQASGFMPEHAQYNDQQSERLPLRPENPPTAQSSRNLAIGPLPRLDCQGQQCLRDRQEDLVLPVVVKNDNCAGACTLCRYRIGLEADSQHSVQNERIAEARWGCCFRDGVSHGAQGECRTACGIFASRLTTTCLAHGVV